MGDGKKLGLCQPFERLLAAAYNVSQPRILAGTPLPEGNFDFIASTARNQGESLRQQAAEQFGIVARPETNETDVLLLTLNQHNARGLKVMKISSKTRWTRLGEGQICCSNAPMWDLAASLENFMGIPVLDETGIKGRFYGELNWEDSGRFHPDNPEGLKRAIRDQFGLELVPARRSIEMLVVGRPADGH